MIGVTRNPGYGHSLVILQNELIRYHGYSKNSIG